MAELQIAQQRQRHSPALDPHLHLQSPNGHVYVQREQRILSEGAQAQFMRMQPAIHEEQEVLRAEAMRRIMETERMEEKRRRKAAKIAHMVSPPLYLIESQRLTPS